MRSDLFHKMVAMKTPFCFPVVSHLRDLSLDCYKYATNDLLQCVSRHAFLTRLSLTACQFITDQGLLSLTSE